MIGNAFRAVRVIAIAIVVIPIAVVAGLFSKGRQSKPAEFGASLRKFADGTEGERDWDEVESVPMRDAHLESIRQEVMQMDFPLQSPDRKKLIALAEKAQHFSR